MEKHRKINMENTLILIINHKLEKLKYHLFSEALISHNGLNKRLGGIYYLLLKFGLLICNIN